MQDRAFSQLLGLAGTLSLDFLESAALTNNPLGDPATRPVAVYQPPGYDAEGSRRYPALYVLHGYTGDVAALVSARAWQTNVAQWADRMILSGKLPPVLLVIVDGFTRLGGSQYVRLDPQRCVCDLHGPRRRGSRRSRLSQHRARRRASGLGEVVGRLRCDASRHGTSGRLCGVRFA